MTHFNTPIDRLINIIRQGGSVRTGIDIYNSKKVKKIDKEQVIDTPDVLLDLKNEGISSIPISKKLGGGTWNINGDALDLNEEKLPAERLSDIDKRLKEITAIKREAVIKFEKAKQNIKKVISDIKNTGGEFEYGQVEETVTELLEFINTDESAFSLLTREIFDYDDYLYNHSINVCTIGTPVIKRFIDKFGKQAEFDYPDKIKEISIGYFMHDVGKVLLPEEILNKKGPLTDEEFEIIKTHSYQLGMQVFEKNKLSNPLILESVRCHHAAIYVDEARCYPTDVVPDEIPPYVKICKLADIYDAMTSKRCYKDAFNPIEVVTDLYQKYAQKNNKLQYLLHAFVSVVGIYPPGSVVFLNNGQWAYLLDSRGPVVMPFTDQRGDPLKIQADPIDLQNQNSGSPEIKIDHKRPLTSPIEVYNKMPDEMKKMIFSTR